MAHRRERQWFCRNTSLPPFLSHAATMICNNYPLAMMNLSIVSLVERQHAFLTNYTGIGKRTMDLKRTMRANQSIMLSHFVCRKIPYDFLFSFILCAWKTHPPPKELADMLENALMMTFRILRQWGETNKSNKWLELSINEALASATEYLAKYDSLSSSLN